MAVEVGEAPSATPPRPSLQAPLPTSTRRARYVAVSSIASLSASRTGDSSGDVGTCGLVVVSDGYQTVRTGASC